MDINLIRNQLRINRHRLDEELELQAYVAEQISTEVAKLKSRTEAANEALKDIEARLVLDMRDEGNKQTVAEMTARIQRDRTRKAQADQVAVVKHELLVWEGLQEAWKQRSFALRNLASLYSSDYFAQMTQSISSSSGKPVVEVQYSAGRAAMAEKRSTMFGDSKSNEAPTTGRVRRRIEE